MEPNYMLIVGAAVAQFILGALWYSPLLFGKLWMEIMEMSHLTKEEQQKMQKEMAPFYGLQLLLSIVTTFVLSMFIHSMPDYSAYMTALVVLVGFIIPTQIAGVIWANTKKKFWAKQIFVMVSYQFVGIMLAAFILSM